jgi:DNA-binding transcriptional LysR family regulator
MRPATASPLRERSIGETVVVPKPPARATNANPLSAADLAAFVATVEASSVHGAADALDLTQSAVTKRLQSLERRAGVELFQRGRFGVRPTAAGRLLYPEAKQALAALQHAHDVLCEHRELADRALTLAASHTIGEFLLPGWLSSFRTTEPRTRAQVEIVNSPGVLHAVREREAQIGFVEGLDDLTGFERLTLYRDSIVVVVSAGHRWSRRRSVRAEELVTEPYLTREAGSGTRAIVSDGLGRAGVVLQPTVETASLQSVKRGLASGGFSLLSSLAIEAEQRQGILQGIPVRDVELVRELRAVHDCRFRLTGPARRFWSWLAETVAAPPAGRPTPARTTKP